MTTRKPLKNEFTKWGDHFKQIKREGNVAIFSRVSPSGREQFEVIVVGSHDGYELQGAKVDAAEVYASTSAWGSHGFTCLSRERAEIRFSELLERSRKEEPEKPKEFREELF